MIEWCTCIWFQMLTHNYIINKKDTNIYLDIRSQVSQTEGKESYNEAYGKNMPNQLIFSLKPLRIYIYI